MGNDAQPGTYTQAWLNSQVLLAEQGKEIEHLVTSVARIETAVDRNQSSTTKGFEKVNEKLDTISAKHVNCQDQHDNAKEDRDRLRSWIKIQWGATGLGTVIGSIFGLKS